MTQHHFEDNVRIEMQPTRRLAALPHQGDYAKISTAFEALGAVLAKRDLWSGVEGMAGVYHDDPKVVAEAALQSHAAAIVGPDFPIQPPLEEITLSSGPHAVLRFKGPYSDLHLAYDDLYHRWLPASGRAPAEAPPFEIYLNSPADTAPTALLTDICLPLRPE